MVRTVALVVVLLSLAPGPGRAQEDGTILSVQCLNCEDPELLAWLQPLDPEADRFTCSLKMALTIEADGVVVEAYPLEEELPPLCEQRASLWSGATRWSVERGPIAVNLPLEFEIQQTIEPKCLEGCDFQRVLDELRRAGSIRGGLECETVMGIQIDTEGRVIDTSVLDGDRDQACVFGLSRWARSTRWSTAYNRGEPVVVWIRQRLRVETR